MTQPFKVCPQCRQPAVLEMPQCRRCGYVYPPAGFAPPGPQPAAPPTSARPLSAAAQREVARGASVQRPRPVAFLLLLALLACMGIGFAYLRHVAEKTVPMGDLTARREHPAVPPADPTGGPFVERPGQSEMPTVHVTLEGEGTMTLVLRDAQGQVYRAACTEQQPATIQVPPGDYNVEALSDAPGTSPNYGTATFRRFKEYDADFGYTTDADPIRLGDGAE